MPTHKPKNILIAPLDWGLGHTTRCIPLIQHLLAGGHNVTVAGNEVQRSFITQALGSSIPTVHLDGYNVRYSGWNKYGQIGVLSQLPGIYKTIWAEHMWLARQCRSLQLHGVISDNRYGMYHAGISSVIITHQLQVQTGMGAIANRTARKVNYKLLHNFDATWVADVAGTPNLGGDLSHSRIMPVHARYMGLLSRFGQGPANDVDTGKPLLVLLSGPEPQRTVLSRLLWEQLKAYTGKVVFIEGNAWAVPPAHIPPNIEYHKLVASGDLAAMLSAAGTIICRSGYSTLMDLIALGKRAILIPTPGQTEQEYLARYLHSQGIFYSTPQKGFNLASTLRDAQTFPYNTPALGHAFTQYKQVVDNWVESL